MPDQLLDFLKHPVYLQSRLVAAYREQRLFEASDIVWVRKCRVRICMIKMDLVVQQKINIKDGI